MQVISDRQRDREERQTRQTDIQSTLRRLIIVSGGLKTHTGRGLGGAFGGSGSAFGGPGRRAWSFGSIGSDPIPIEPLWAFLGTDPPSPY